jgi:hypothetical protein
VPNGKLRKQYSKYKPLRDGPTLVQKFIVTVSAMVNAIRNQERYSLDAE